MDSDRVVKTSTLLILVNKFRTECSFSILNEDILMKILFLSMMSEREFIKKRKKRQLCSLIKKVLIYCPEAFKTIDEEIGYLCFEAIALKGNSENVEKMIELGVSETFSDRLSISHICSSSGRSEALDIILRHRVPSKEQIANLFKLASLYNRTNVLTVLKKNNLEESIHELDQEYIEKAAIVMCSSNSFSFFECLLEKLKEFDAKGSNILKRCLERSADLGNLEIVKLVIESGYDVNTKLNGKKTLLNVIALKKSFERPFFQFLIDKGIKIDYEGNHGSSALYESLMSENNELAMELIKEGADVDFNIQKRNCVPIHLAAMSNPSREVFAVMLEMTKEDKIILFKMSIGGGSITNLKYFVETLGFDVNMRFGKDRRVPIFYSVNNYENFVYLLEKGASLRKKDASGASVYDFAVMNGAKRIAEHLELNFPDLFKNETRKQD
jgi:ankyrin repeat protein